METLYPKVCIVILNWNGYELTKDCLFSLQKIDYPNYKIILVDNGSKDGSVAKLTREFSDYIDILALEKNYGFTGGNNLGIQYAKEKYAPDYYLLLNNDTTVNDSLILELLNAFKNDPKCYAAVPKILLFDSPDTIWFAGGSISRLTGIVSQHGIYNKDADKYNVAGPTDYMNGCCALISKESIDQIGILDDRFFANSEDADYSLRITNAGFHIQYVPAGVVYHKVNQAFKSNRGQWFAYYLTARNLIQLQKKHLPKWKLPFFAVVFSVRWVFYLTVKFSLTGDFKSIKGIYQGAIDGITGNLRFVKA